MESTLSFSCSRSDTLYPVKVRLSPTLTLSPLMIWYSEQTDLFLFLLAKAAPAYLPTALSMALRPLFPFQQAHYVQVFPLNPAPSCKLFAGLGSINKSATSLLLLSDSRCVLATLSSPLSFLSPQFLWQICRNCLLSSPVLPDYNGSPDTRFSGGTTRMISWQEGEHFLHPLQSFVVSLLLFLVFTLFFSWTGGVLSHRNFSTRRFFRFPLRNLCSLVTLVVFSLVYTATDTAFC